MVKRESTPGEEMHPRRKADESLSRDGAVLGSGLISIGIQSVAAHSISFAVNVIAWKD